MDSINLRIKSIREELKLNQTDFGKRLGLGRSYISAIELGQRNILDRLVLEICREFNISEKWLRTGEGDKHPPQTHPARIKKLVDLFNSVDYDKQKAILDLLKSMQEE